MGQRPRDIGTACESAVVRYLQASAFPAAERRALRGIGDAGDITGTPGVCWSIKGGKAAERASDLDIRFWMAELRTQRANANEPLMVMVTKRKGFGVSRADKWWAHMTPAQIGWLLAGSPSVAPHFAPAAYDSTTRMTLEVAVELLLLGGWGSPLEPVQAVAA
jgi:hypothetical protein